MGSFRQLVIERQNPLCDRYRSRPEDALTVSRARTLAGASLDPFHAAVLAGGREEVPWRVAAPREIGGFDDLPTPSDLLCGALASCLGTTLRLTAARLDVPIEDFEVRVSATQDVRGALGVDPLVPVGLQRIRCRVRWRTRETMASERAERVVEAAQRASAIVQTLCRGVQVDIEVEMPRRGSGDAPRREG